MNRFAKCLRCGGALPCFSIEWSNLHDEDKCACSNPVLPAHPFDEIIRRFVDLLFHGCAHTADGPKGTEANKS